MKTIPDGWKVVGSDPLIAIFEYSFGPGTANALAVGVDGGVIVVSPLCRVSASVFDAVATSWNVKALVETGEALVRVREASGLVWYVTDFILNMAELPAHPIARMAFRFSGSAPGLRLNRIGPLFMVKDHAALRRWLRAEAERETPRWLIPAHGDVVDLSNTPNRLCDLLG